MITNEEWKIIRKIFPNYHKEKRDLSNRKFVTAYKWFFYSEKPWSELPKEFGNGDSAGKRLRRLKKSNPQQIELINLSFEKYESEKKLTNIKPKNGIIPLSLDIEHINADKTTQVFIHKNFPKLINWLSDSEIITLTYYFYGSFPIGELSIAQISRSFKDSDSINIIANIVRILRRKYKIFTLISKDEEKELHKKQYENYILKVILRNESDYEIVKKHTSNFEVYFQEYFNIDLAKGKNTPDIPYWFHEFMVFHHKNKNNCPNYPIQLQAIDFKINSDYLKYLRDEYTSENKRKNLSNRIMRAIKQMKFIEDNEIPLLSEYTLKKKLKKVIEKQESKEPSFFSREHSFYLDLMISMYKTNCQELTGKKLSTKKSLITQGIVKHHFEKMLVALKYESSVNIEYFEYYKMFKAISEHLNILKSGRVEGYENKTVPLSWYIQSQLTLLKS